MNKNALVLGATGGIGEAIVHMLALQGYNIGIHYNRNKEKALYIDEQVKRSNVKGLVVQGDVADEAQMTQLFSEVTNQLGKLDVIINTAGIMRLAPIAELDLDIFDQVMRTNVRGTFVIAKLATTALNDGGMLLNFSTSVTKTHFENYGAYAAAKSAIETLTLILAKEWRGKNLRVNTIAPGPTATPLFLEGKPKEVIQQLSLANPLERLGTPNDIAQAVFSIIEAKWINGQIIFANGGMI